MRFKPMLPVEQPLGEQSGFVHEIKWDGYRALAYLDGDQVLLESRNGHSLNNHFPTIVKSLSELRMKGVIDGELIAFSSDGKVDFSSLRGSRRNAAPLMYIVFDVLYVSGENICSKPWFKRRECLEELVFRHEQVVLSPLLPNDLKTNLNMANENQLEGIISKQKNSPYLPGVRSIFWRKHKIVRTIDCVVVGLRLRKGKISSLAVGLYQQNGAMLHVGNVASGLSQREIDFLSQSVNLLEQKSSAVINPPQNGADWIWFNPHLVVEIRYLELTAHLRLRHPVFVQFRFDKSPGECRFEGDK